MTHAAVSHRAIRIALAGIPRLTADLVRRCLRGQHDIAIVRELRFADVVVTALTADGVPRPCQELFFGNRGVPVIAVSRDGRLEIYDRRVLREAALDELLAEIRRVAPALTEPTPTNRR